MCVTPATRFRHDRHEFFAPFLDIRIELTDCRKCAGDNGIACASPGSLSVNSARCGRSLPEVRASCQAQSQVPRRWRTARPAEQSHGQHTERKWDLAGLAYCSPCANPQCLPRRPPPSQDRHLPAAIKPAAGLVRRCLDLPLLSLIFELNRHSRPAKLKQWIMRSAFQWPEIDQASEDPLLQRAVRRRLECRRIELVARDLHILPAGRQ